jgi:hypothetical protein
MSDALAQSDWYYVGHYGQLGPLTLEQLLELAGDGVVAPDTYVWRSGMTEWAQASQTPELRAAFESQFNINLPPPAPIPLVPISGSTPAAPAARPQIQMTQGSWSYLQSSVPSSDKNRVTAGLLNLIPGVGRFYLGYAAHGALQLLTTVFCGVGVIWSIIDGLYILMGGVKYDGYGRVLQD